jgi:selenide,water dikinase
MAPGDLQEVLAALKGHDAGSHPDVLVGLGSLDDAAVVRLTDDVAIVETVDFFPPVVDDPWTWGAIAAANAMSDVYAMGGRVLFALAVAGFPREFPTSIIVEVFRGGADKMAEAGGVVVGGHTVVDAEPKYGLCVTGRVDPRRVLTKGGFAAGTRLFLSKPLGTGVIVTAAKSDAAGAAALESAIASMLRLNRTAAEVAREMGATGATDISGFGFLGHLAEVVTAGGIGVRIDGARLPVLPGALDLAGKGFVSGGMGRNRRHVEATLKERLRISAGVPAALVNVLFESETSGGLCFAVRRELAGKVEDAFGSRGEPCWEIGEVTPIGDIVVE